MLAGGRSTRFGRDKLAEEYRGIPMLHHPILRLGEVCAEVVVVLAPHAPEPRMPTDVAIRIVRDAIEGEGPLAGACAGLGVVQTDLAIVAGGDMPELRAPVLLEMLRIADDEHTIAVALGDGDRFRPLPCVLRSTHAVDVARALLDDGHRRLRTLLRAIGVAVIEERIWTALDPDRRTLFDVDEPSDLDR